MVFAPRVQDLCGSRRGRPGLSVLMSLTVSTHIRGHEALHHHHLRSQCSLWIRNNKAGNFWSGRPDDRRVGQQRDRTGNKVDHLSERLLQEARQDVWALIKAAATSYIDARGHRHAATDP